MKNSRLDSVLRMNKMKLELLFSFVSMYLSPKQNNQRHLLFAYRKYTHIESVNVAA